MTRPFFEEFGACWRIVLFFARFRPSIKYWATLLTWLYSTFIADMKKSVGMPDDPDVECFVTAI